MPYPCEIAEQVKQPTLTVRARTSVENISLALGAAYGEIFGYLGELQVQPAGMPFTIFYNLDMQDLDIEIGVAVARPLPEKGTMHAGELPAGKIAACLYTGPYSECGPAYEELQRFIQEQGYEASGIAMEYYLNGPETPPEELQTRIVFLLKSPEVIAAESG